MNPLDSHSALQTSECDIEKQGELKGSDINVLQKTENHDFLEVAKTNSSSSSNQYGTAVAPMLPNSRIAKWNAKVEGLAGFEARGITRVLPGERHGGGRRDYLQMFALWFSMDLVVISIITGLLGPLVFELGWVDSVCIVIFASAASVCPVSYISTFGPESGNRTMV